MNRTTKLIAGTLATVGLGLGAAATAGPSAQAAGTGTTAAASACSGTSVFRVTWDYAGVYSRKTRSQAYQVDTKRNGEQVTGPSGETRDGWTEVRRGNGDRAYMVDDAIKYEGCR